MIGDWQIRRHRVGGRGRIVLAVVAVTAISAVVATSLFFEPPAPRWLEGMPAAAELASSQEQLMGPPTRLRIPKIGVDASLTPLKMDDSGELAAPEDYQQPGWYEEGTTPGDVGPAVIAGHLDSKDGRAVFYRLERLRSGDLVLVQRDGKWLTFEVVSTGRFAKNKFPTAEVYGPTPDSQLRLVTCGGTFDRARGSYRDNIVIFAVKSS